MLFGDRQKLSWPVTIISWLGREMRIDRLWNHVSLWLQTSLLHPNSGLSRIMFFPVCIKFKVTVFSSHSSKCNTSVSADFLSAFFIAMEHEFMKVISSYRQQRDFVQKIQHLSVLFPHFQCQICLSISSWISWCAANLPCCDAANKSIYQTISKISSFQTFFLGAAEHCLLQFEKHYLGLTIPAQLYRKTQLRMRNAERQ